MADLVPLLLWKYMDQVSRIRLTLKSLIFQLLKSINWSQEEDTRIQEKHKNMYSTDERSINIEKQ